MKKKLLCIVLTVALLFTLSACIGEKEKVIAENEAANKDFIQASTQAIGDETLALHEKLNWGESYDEVKDEVKGPYHNDSSQYITKAFYANLPQNGEWIDEEKNIQPKNFVSTDILAYYMIDPSLGLNEYGYMAADVNLYQYDFLKMYYTKKYGEPEREDWEWKNESHIESETDEEERYQLFEEGYIRVLTVWDIEELDSVLVIDWLKDPAKRDNNYGQISFYKRTDEFSVESMEEK